MPQKTKPHPYDYLESIDGQVIMKETPSLFPGGTPRPKHLGHIPLEVWDRGEQTIRAIGAIPVGFAGTLLNKLADYSTVSYDSLGRMVDININNKDMILKNRSDFDNLLDRAMRAKDMGDVDPLLKSAYTKRGIQGIHSNIDDVWGKNIPLEGKPHIPADLSQKGKYVKRFAGSTDDIHSILTVTPDAESARFQSAKSDSKIGGGSGDMLWGNAKDPRYGYAEGNWGIKTVKDSSNPSAHFSAAHLEPGKKGKYMYTGDVENIHRTGKRPTWGVNESSNRGGGDINSGADVMFGKETRRYGGLTTANDLYTEIKNLGVEPPKRMNMGNSKYLRKLTETYRKLSHAKTDFDALSEMASPQPQWGNPSRDLGQLPTADRYMWNKADKTQKIKSGAPNPNPKYDSPFEYIPNQKDVNPLDPNYIVHDLDEGKGVLQHKANLITPPKTGLGQRLRNHSGGLVATALTSPEAVELARQGRHGDAALMLGGSYATGEIIGKGTNLVVSEAAKRGHYWPGAAAGIAGKFLNPIGAIQIASMAERSTPKIDHSKAPPEWQEHISKVAPGELGKHGPESYLLFDVDADEAKRIRSLPRETQYVKALPVGNQLIHNLRKWLGN